MLSFLAREVQINAKLRKALILDGEALCLDTMLGYEDVAMMNPCPP
jgi:hypothetical protein